MQEVDVRPRSLDQLISMMTTERARAFAESGRRARAAFGDRTIWHVNATAHGGGVAEMLQTLLAYGNASRIENRWLVLDGEPEFFAVTKRLHNRLHGDPGDGGPLGDDEHAGYERVLATNIAEMVPLIDRRDIVVLHDPQAAGMVDAVRATGARVAWRCHIGRDTTNDQTDDGWAFLRPYIEHGRRLRVLETRLRAGLGRPAAARRDPALDRPVLGQEPRARSADGHRGARDGAFGQRRRSRRADPLRAP